MTSSALPPRFLGERVQLAYIVRDLDAAMKYWTDVLRVGPFVVIEKSRGNRTMLHRGKPTLCDFQIAFAYMGDIQVEFISPLNDEPSSYKEFLDSGREGLHHLGYWPADFAGTCAQLEAHGFTELSSMLAEDGSRNVVYYETPAHLGSVIEIVPLTDERKAYFGRIHRLSQTWDGVTRPVRRFVDRAAFLASGEGAA